MGNSPELQKELARAVRTVFDDYEYVVGIRSFCYDDRDRKRIIDFIHAGKNVTTETVLVYAIRLRKDPPLYRKQAYLLSEKTIKKNGPVTGPFLFARKICSLYYGKEANGMPIYNDTDYGALARHYCQKIIIRATYTAKNGVITCIDWMNYCVWAIMAYSEHYPLEDIVQVFHGIPMRKGRGV